jgi:peroxiredoxin
MLINQEGKRVPHVTFKVFKNSQWTDISTGELFSNKTVIVFAVPGAFTYPCSPIQVLGFNEYADIFKENGIDDIICMSVNDTFVLDEWAREEAAERIHFIPDGNGDFARGMGMIVDQAECGLGERSWRYSMLVRDTLIEKMFIEPEVSGDPCRVSDADTMLEYINPAAPKPKRSVTLTQIWRTLLSV